MKHARGYISHIMMGGRSVPQSIQQKIIRQYCEQNGWKFLLSATEFEGHSIMLESINEQFIVMYSLWCMPKDKAARKRLYDSGKEVWFAAENMKMDAELLETVFSIEDYHAGSQFSSVIAQLNVA